MKMTKTRAFERIQGLKSGLSIVLAIVLLGNITQPLRVFAASPEESAATTETVAEVPPQPFEPISTVQEILKQVCQENTAIPEVRQESCSRDLFGIMMQESRGKATAVGDHGLARGWFQINRRYNPEVSAACAEDLHCSAAWTLDNLVSNQYLKYANWAIWCHNGCNINPHYVPAVRFKTAKYWDEPMPIVTADALRALALE